MYNMLGQPCSNATNASPVGFESPLSYDSLRGYIINTECFISEIEH